MTALVAPLPLLLVIALLASGRAGALGAGLAGLGATAALAFLLAAPAAGGAAAIVALAREMPAGLWLAWPVVAIIVSGMFFHRATLARPRAPAPEAGPGQATPRRLWSLCFLLAPFAESVTGFGVGYVIALAALRAQGIGGLPALLLGLFSQSLVPWGALAAGTTVGAALAAMPAAELGFRTALVQAPIHALYLLLYWRFARAAGVVVPTAGKLEDLAWTALLIALVALANRTADPEIAGAAPCALLLALRYWRDERPDRQRLAQALHAVAPYAVLVAALCATRLIGPLRQGLLSIAPLTPLPDLPTFAPLYAPGTWVIGVGIGVALAARASLARLTVETARSAWRACAVTVVFLLMARLYQSTGLADAIAGELRAHGDAFAALGVPPLAALGGFLTGSAAAASAMLMPMELALAREVGMDAGWMAAVQTAVSANLSMLSPMRVSMGTAILGMAAAERELYRRAWPLALPPIAAGTAVLSLLALS
jgi:lactate permease